MQHRVKAITVSKRIVVRFVQFYACAEELCVVAPSYDGAFGERSEGFLDVVEGADDVLAELNVEAVFWWFLKRDYEDVAFAGEVQVGELGQCV